MPSRGTRTPRKAGTHRMDGAIAALTPLGFSKNLIRHTIKELLKVYGDNDAGWYFVEENYYKLVIENIIEEQDKEKEEHDPKLEENKEAIVSAEAMTKVSSEQPPLQLEAGSSSGNRELPNIPESSPEGSPITFEEYVSSPEGSPKNLEKPSPERAPIKSEEGCDLVHGVEPSQIIPKREPCYGWISESEEEED